MTLVCDGRGHHHWHIPSAHEIDPTDPTARDWRCLNCQARKPAPDPMASFNWQITGKSRPPKRKDKHGNVADLGTMREMDASL